MPQLTTPVITVILDDGTEHELQCINIDLLNWDRERAKRGWPLPDVAPMVWATYVAYRAALRLGVVEAGLTLDQWEAKALQVRPLVRDDGAVSSVDPTPSGAAPE